MTRTRLQELLMARFCKAEKAEERTELNTWVDGDPERRQLLRLVEDRRSFLREAARLNRFDPNEGYARLKARRETV